MALDLPHYVKSYLHVIVVFMFLLVHKCVRMQVMNGKDMLIEFSNHDIGHWDGWLSRTYFRCI